MSSFRHFLTSLSPTPICCTTLLIHSPYRLKTLPPNLHPLSQGTGGGGGRQGSYVQGRTKSESNLIFILYNVFLTGPDRLNQLSTFTTFFVCLLTFYPFPTYPLPPFLPRLLLLLLFPIRNIILSLLDSSSSYYSYSYVILPSPPEVWDRILYLIIRRRNRGSTGSGSFSFF